MSDSPIDTPILDLIANPDDDALRAALNDVHPFDVAQAVEELENAEIWAFLRRLGDPLNADVFSHLDLDHQAELVQEHAPEETAPLLERMAPDDRVDVLQAIDDELRERILARMTVSQRRVTERLAGYEEGTAGGVMSPEFAALPADLTVAEAIGLLRLQAPRKETIYDIFVIDDASRLIGVVGLKDLILASPKDRISEIMRAEVISIRADEDRNEAARKIREYDLLTLPVVQGDNRLVGLVTVDDVLDVTEEEATTDFHRMASVGNIQTDLLGASMSLLYRKRIPWLLVLVLMNVFSGAGIAYFEDTIAAAVALVFFLPLLIDSGGNAGSQSATLVVRSLATGETVLRDWLRLLRREVLIAGALGLTMGLAVSMLGFLRAGPDIALVVAVTMVLVVIVGSLIGMSLPFILTRLKMDPATASAPLVTSLADICGVLIYFSIATWWLGLQAA
ncbi:MAG: magnesium transporter [Phycisphaerales bacterium]|nr:MAG: magnesium transporter [Phycisphaerales bacterium]